MSTSIFVVLILSIENHNHCYEISVLSLNICLFIQDALDFFLHLIDRVEQANPGNHELNPCSGFKFIIEERVQCPSGKVSYNKRSDYILSLGIPLHEATNKGSFKHFAAGTYNCIGP